MPRLLAGYSIGFMALAGKSGEESAAEAEQGIILNPAVPAFQPMHTLSSKREYAYSLRPEIQFPRTR